MKTILFIVSILFVSSHILYALPFNENNGYSENVIFFEVGGNGLGASINYERFLKENVGVRVGFGTLVTFGISVPVMLNYYVGKENNKLELGGGLIYFGEGIKDSFFGDKGAILLGLTIGLRHQKQFRGLVIRVSLTPLYNTNLNKAILYGGLSLGFSF